MKAQDLKNSILQLAIQGKLVPQDPNDEPASELLKKIKAEKAELVKQGKIKKEKQESYIFRGDDNKYYEQIGSETKDITDEIPFDIPNNWEWVRIKFLCDTYTGNSISENIKKSKYTNLSAGYNYIGTKDVGFDNTINYENGVKIPFKEEKFRYAYPEDILLCIEGGSAGRKIAILSQTVCFGNKLCDFHQYLNQTRYLYYLLQSPYFFGIFKENISGIIGGVSINKIKELIIPLPPLAEQKRIVKKIEELEPFVEEYGKAETELTALNNNFPEQIKKSILQYAIQGKLVEQDPNDEPASELLKKIKAEKAELVKQGKIKKDKQESYIFKGDDNRHYEQIGSETKDITEEIPFDIPNSWEWVRLGNVINLVSGRDLTPDCYSDLPINDGVPYITGASNIENEQVIVNRWTAKPQTLAYKGDLLLTCKGTVGLIAFLQCESAHIARQIMSLKAFSCIDMDYLKYFVLSYIAELQRKAKSMIPGISRDDVLQTLCPIPPYKEQLRIIQKLSKLLKIIDIL
ncbi:MAG: restriction endonuclease subunit S [Azospirillum sp.]|nr:restriction endonuclease subunit S [Azospirillum sp.]